MNCEYIDEVWPEPALSPKDAAGRADMRAWMRYLEEVPTVATRIPSFNKLFVKPYRIQKTDDEYEEMIAKMPLRKHFYRQMTVSSFSEEQTRDSLEKLRKTLERAEKALADGRPLPARRAVHDRRYRADPLGDPHGGSGLAQIWADLPRFQGWLDRIKARPSFDVAYVPGSRVNPETHHIKQAVPDVPEA